MLVKLFDVALLICIFLSLMRSFNFSNVVFMIIIPSTICKNSSFKPTDQRMDYIVFHTLYLFLVHDQDKPLYYQAIYKVEF